MIALLAGLAAAATYVVGDSPVMVPIDAAQGVVVQLPGPVRVVTPTAHLRIAQLAEADPSQGVRHLQVQLSAPDSAAEQVTFLLADGRAASVRFVASANADAFADLKFPAPPNRPRHGFLAPELALLRAMLTDSPHRRQVTFDEFSYTQYPELGFELRRKFQENALVGYVFVLENRTKEILQLDPSVLNVDQPNRAVLLQLDHDILLPCTSADVWDPDGDSCRTALRMVVRQHGSESEALALGSELPFVVVEQ